jgi:hypothetical protein
MLSPKIEIHRTPCRATRGGCAEATTRESQRERRQIKPKGLLTGSSGWLALSRKGKFSSTGAEHKRTCGAEINDRQQLQEFLSCCRQSIVAFAGCRKNGRKGHHSFNASRFTRRRRDPTFKWSQSPKSTPKTGKSWRSRAIAHLTQPRLFAEVFPQSL